MHFLVEEFPHFPFSDKLILHIRRTNIKQKIIDMNISATEYAIYRIYYYGRINIFVHLHVLVYWYL